MWAFITLIGEGASQLRLRWAIAPVFGGKICAACIPRLRGENPGTDFLSLLEFWVRPEQDLVGRFASRARNGLYPMLEITAGGFVLGATALAKMAGTRAGARASRSMARGLAERGSVS